MFNKGWYCKQCGPVKDSKKRSINKVQTICCKACGNPVTEWERPLKERIGHCGNCGHASFKLALVKSHLIRVCKRCAEAVDTDEDNKVVRKGSEINEQ